jgi:four helix bundle protein
MARRGNKIRAFRKLDVWKDARDLYVLTCQIFLDWPFELKRVVANQLASVDSVHRNIAEGYCRKSLKEYLQFLNVAKASLGESVSGMQVYYKAKQLGKEEFQKWDDLSFRLENGMIRLIASLERKQSKGDWDDSFYVEECNIIYKTAFAPEEEE